MKRYEQALRNAVTKAAVEHVQPAIEFSEITQGKLSAAIGKYAAEPATGVADSWCLLESPEGEYPRIRVFKKLAMLLNYVKHMEGTETAVAIVRGTPLSLSKVLEGNRYLLMGDSAIRIGDSSATVLPQSSLVGLTRQEDGWLGDAIYTLDAEEELDD